MISSRRGKEKTYPQSPMKGKGVAWGSKGVHGRRLGLSEGGLVVGEGRRKGVLEDVDGDSRGRRLKPLHDAETPGSAGSHQRRLIRRRARAVSKRATSSLHTRSRNGYLR